MAEDEKKGEGFVIKDKRFSAKKEESEPEAKEMKKESTGEQAPRDEPRREEDPEPEPPLPEINFTNFLLSLHTSALIQLGEVQDPSTGQDAKNIPLARQTIDLIGMIQEKTKGNLTDQEERILENILYDLRMRFVKASG